MYFPRPGSFAGHGQYVIASLKSMKLIISNSPQSPLPNKAGVFPLVRGLGCGAG